MAIRLRCMSVLCSGLLMVPMAQADMIKGGASLGYVFGHSVESMFAQLPLDVIDHDLIILVTELTYGKTPEEVVQEVAYFYRNTANPLLTAAHALAKHKDYVGAAMDVAQCMLDVTSAGSPRNEEVKQWIGDLNTILTCIEYVLIILKDNPQLVAMILK